MDRSRYSSGRDAGFDVSIPDEVQKFCIRFEKAVREHKVYDIMKMYTKDFERISQRYYVASPWPKPDTLADGCDHDFHEHFMCLYRELYFRHQFTRLELPSNRDTLERLELYIEESLDCWDNYISLFNFLIQQPDSERELELDLPNQWLWDIIDMFVLQFQEWNSLKSKYQAAVHELEEMTRDFRDVVHKNTFEGRGVDWQAVRQELDRQHIFVDLSIRALEDRYNDGAPEPKDYSWTEANRVWSPIVMLRYFHALVNKGQVHVKFNRVSSLDDRVDDLSNIARVGAYFAIVGLLRMHTLYGDYSTALRVLDSIDLSNRSVVFAIQSCRISTHYFMGFCFLMLRRYTDAVKTFERILVDHLRPAQRHSDDPRDPSERVLQRMRPLLVMAHALSQHPIDEALVVALKETFKDDWHGLVNCDESAHKKLFNLGRPDFISLSQQSANERDSSEMRQASPAEEQCDIQEQNFLREVVARKRMPRLHKFMKFYTAISMDKFQKFLKTTVSGREQKDGEKDSFDVTVDADEQVVSALVNAKLKAREPRWQQGARGVAPADGTWQSARSLDFYADEHTVHIEESKPERHTSALFLKEIDKSEKCADKVARLQFMP